MFYIYTNTNMQITKNENNLVIDNFLVIWDTPEEDKIFLSTKIWPDMNYKKTDYKYIDYPGEYEFDNIYIICTNDEDKLNYKIRLTDKYIWYIQSSKFVKESFIEEMDDLFVTSEELVNKVSKVDFDGNIHDISKL